MRLGSGLWAALVDSGGYRCLLVPQRSTRAGTRRSRECSDLRSASTLDVRLAFLLANRPTQLADRSGEKCELVAILSIPD